MEAVGLISRVSSRTYRDMEKQSLLITTSTGSVLDLEDYIRELKRPDTEVTLESSRLTVVNNSTSHDTKTPEERLAYQQRVNRLKAKIEAQEYDDMTRNVRGNLHHGFASMLAEVGSASRLAYSLVTIALSMVASMLAFYFIPVLLLPQTIPLGARIICGLI